MLRPSLDDREDFVVVQLVFAGNWKVVQCLNDLSHDNHKIFLIIISFGGGEGNPHPPTL